MNDYELWRDVEEDGYPQEAGIYLGLKRGDTKLTLLRFDPSDRMWKTVGMGGSGTKNVTHWTKIPPMPVALRENILLRKAGNEGLEPEEKLELAQLLRNSVK